MIVDVQFIPSHMPWGAYLEAVLAAEQAGFGTIWALDHLSGSSFGGDTMLECFSSLGALAMATTRIGLGTLVANVANRHAGVIAAGATTVQEISGGRFTLGIGAGTSPGSRFAREQIVVGVPIASTMAQRHRRVDDVLDLLEAQWAGDRDAEHWRGFPRPRTAPGLLLGVNSIALAELAGRRTDGVNLRADHPERAAILTTARAAHDRHRPDRPWTSSVWTQWTDDALDAASPLRVALAADGVDRIILSTTAPDVAAIGRAGQMLGLTS